MRPTVFLLAVPEGIHLFFEQTTTTAGANTMSYFENISGWYEGRHPAVKAILIVGAGVAAVVGGVGAAPTIGAAASAAGIGTAGGTLSGAAASSAGLAAIGGGSMATGGAGVAGETTK